MDKLKSCEFEGTEYSHDADVCTADKCMKCDDVEWKLYSKSL